MDMITVAMDPYENIKNKSIGILKKAMDGNVRFVPFHRGLKIDYQVAHLNFYENIYDKTKLEAFIIFIKKVGRLYYLKLKGVKIVITIHDRFVHDCEFPVLTHLLLKVMCRLADAITIMCEESKSVISEIVGDKNYKRISGKIAYIPHQHYIGAYPDNGEDVRKEFHIKEDDFVFLYFGLVRPYKNVELILEVAKRFENRKNVHFIIAGEPENSEYKKQIEDEIGQRGNIISILKFIPDEKIASLFRASNIVILPFDLKSSLNSGTCFLAFSIGRNVICPLNGTMKELKTAGSYTYTYKTEQEHLEELYKKAEEAYQDYMEDVEAFKNVGDALYQEVVANNDPVKIGELYIKLYQKVLE